MLRAQVLRCAAPRHPARCATVRLCGCPTRPTRPTRGCSIYRPSDHSPPKPFALPPPPPPPPRSYTHSARLRHPKWRLLFVALPALAGALLELGALIATADVRLAYLVGNSLLLIGTAGLVPAVLYALKHRAKLQLVAAGVAAQSLGAGADPLSAAAAAAVATARAGWAGWAGGGGASGAAAGRGVAAPARAGSYAPGSGDAEEGAGGAHAGDGKSAAGSAHAAAAASQLGGDGVERRGLVRALTDGRVQRAAEPAGHSWLRWAARPGDQPGGKQGTPEGEGEGEGDAPGASAAPAGASAGTDGAPSARRARRAHATHVGAGALFAVVASGGASWLVYFGALRPELFYPVALLSGAPALVALAYDALRAPAGSLAFNFSYAAFYVTCLLPLPWLTGSAVRDLFFACQGAEGAARCAAAIDAALLGRVAYSPSLFRLLVAALQLAASTVTFALAVAVNERVTLRNVSPQHVFVFQLFDFMFYYSFFLDAARSFDSSFYALLLLSSAQALLRNTGVLTAAAYRLQRRLGTKVQPLDDPLLLLQYTARLGAQYVLADVIASVTVPFVTTWFVLFYGSFRVSGRAPPAAAAAAAAATAAATAAAVVPRLLLLAAAAQPRHNHLTSPNTARPVRTRHAARSTRARRPLLWAPSAPSGRTSRLCFPPSS